MNLIFNGHSFKYEMENLCRMFYPGEKFDIVYDCEPGQLSGDIIAAERIKQSGNTLLSVRIMINRQLSALNDSLDNTSPDYEKECERILAVLLYRLLSKETGITPKWGILTGIRPVKLVHELREKEMDDSAITEYLHTRYLTGEEKIGLCLKTADVQKHLLQKGMLRDFSLYVSVPFCPSRCIYCSFVSHSIEKTRKLVPEYVEKLIEEITETGRLAKEQGLNLKTVYFGGGTPTALDAEDIKRLTGAVRESFDLSGILEYTYESGRPDTITGEKLQVIKEAGVTRISINPQTLNDDVLREIGRQHTTQQTIDSFHLARDLGFDDINMDVIAGLPSESPESFYRTIDGILDLNPENITVHTLSVKRSSNLLEQAKARYDAKGYEIEDMLDYARTHLYEKSYRPYYLYRQKNTLGNFENVGYAHPGFEGVYNVEIMEEIRTILAVGAGAVTKLYNCGTGQISRVFNYKYPYEYIDRFDDILKRKRQVSEFYEHL